MNRFLYLMGLFLLVACGSNDEEKLTVSGTIVNRDARMIYLEETPVATMQRIVKDSAVIGNGGKFSLKAETLEESIYNLRIDNDVYPFASLVNDSNKITVDADFAKAGEFYTVKGSSASDSIRYYLKRSGEMMRQIYYDAKALDSLKKLPPDSNFFALELRRKEKAEQLKTYTDNSIRSSTSPSVAMFILSTYQGIAKNPDFGVPPFTNEDVGGMIDQLIIKFPQHQGIASVKSYFDGLSSKAGMVGKAAPEISLPDLEGKTVSLSSFRGKYVLVDFWASWCKPCRYENPNVVSAYNKYKSKNFTILGVSLDQNKGAWQKAIVDDKLNWTHISDLQQWRSVVVPTYKIQGIPYNVLVDPQGKVVAENLRGQELDQKLGEFLR